MEITLGGGCFWCIEAVFNKVQGVSSAISGYANGNINDKELPPNYQIVCSGESGFAEVVKIEFDEKKIPLEKILEIFFTIHDPTTINRQGNDVGSQYRSAIYANNNLQLEKVNYWLMNFAKTYSGKIITEIELLREFYPAEDYHQQYFKNNPQQSYCVYVVKAKVDKAYNNFPELLNK